MTAPRVLFLLKWRATPYQADCTQTWGDPGYSDGRPLESGLSNSARMACEMLKRLGVVARLEHVIDGNAIHAAAVKFAATHVIIEAFWVVPAKFDELAKALPGVRFIVRNHSETPFLAGEGIAFEWALEYFKRPNVVVAPNAPRMLADMRFLAGQVRPDLEDGEIAHLVPYLPNYYGLREEPGRPLDIDKSHIDVGCFGAIRPMKNPVTQALGAMRFAAGVGKPLAFHINASRVEMGGSPVLKSLRAIFEGTDHTLVEHPWMDRPDFLTLILSMDLVAQVSFSETFCIVAADAVSEGVPVVSTREVPWQSSLFAADPTDSRDIAAKMSLAYDLKARAPDFNPALDHLRAYNAETRRRWSRYFGGHAHQAGAAAHGD